MEVNNHIYLEKGVDPMYKKSLALLVVLCFLFSITGAACPRPGGGGSGGGGHNNKHHLNP